jgi:predicted Zn-dependent protease
MARSALPDAIGIGALMNARPAEASSARRSKLRLLILGLGIRAATEEIVRRSAPGVGRAIRLRQAERAMAQGRLDDAEGRLALLISEDPRWVQPRLRLVEVARRLGRITEAEEVLQRAVELGLPVEEGRREFALLRAGRDFPLAEKSLRRVLDEHPDDEEVRRTLAEGRSEVR